MPSRRAPSPDEHRLSVDRCRELLGDAGVGLSDDRVVEIREHLYTLAAVLTRSRATGLQLPYDAAVQAMSRERRTEVEERAGILQFEGGLPPDQAERLALGERVSRLKS